MNFEEPRPPEEGRVSAILRHDQEHGSDRMDNSNLGVFEDSLDAVWVDEETPDRLTRDFRAVLRPHIIRQMRSGVKCLRCFEPQETAFPLYCDLCGYPMKDRQIMDMAMEFEGEVFLGPSATHREYLEQLEAEREQDRFERELAAGKRSRGVVIPRGVNAT